MKANYHTHTPRCRHASGTEEAYVNAALAAGFDVLGFADHSPWPYASDFVSDMRMGAEELPGYCRTLRELRARYAGQITLRMGLECEYFPAYMDWLKETKEREGLDYLLLGVHYLNSDETNPYTPRLCQKDAGIRAYAQAACEAMATGLYAYIAHPDLFMRYRPKDGWNKECEKAAHEILTTARAMKMPIEFNLNAQVIQQSSGKSGFPRHEFWVQAADYGVPVIIGADAHQPQLLTNLKVWDAAEAYLRGLGFEMLPCLPMDKAPDPAL